MAQAETEAEKAREAKEFRLETERRKVRGRKESLF